VARALRRPDLNAVGLPALVGASTLVHWLLNRRLHGLWIMPDEAIYGERALSLWRAGQLAVFHGEGSGYGLLYPALAGLPLSVGKLATGYASLKLLQALVMSLVAVPVFFYGRHWMKPRYALIAATLALASPLTLYSGLLMTEVLIYPIGAFALFATVRAVQTATVRHQVVAFIAIAAALLTRAQSVVLVAIFAAAIVVDALIARDRRRLRSFWPVWSILVAAVGTISFAPGVFGAYANTLRGEYPLGSAARLVGDHLAYAALSTAVLPFVALLSLAIEAVRSRGRDFAERALVSVALCAVVFVVLQVGFFAARYAPHLLGRDLALLPPLLFAVFALWLERGARRLRATAFIAAPLVLALLLLTPWTSLVTVNALPDTFDLAILYRLGSTHATLVVALVAVVSIAAFLAVPRRLAWLLPTFVLAVLVVSSAVAADEITKRVNYDQRNLVGIPPNWVERATSAPAAYLYDGEAYWNGVWQLRFWNRNVNDVVALAPSRVPGPMSQRQISVAADGRLPVTERYIVASDPHSFVGTKVAHLTQIDTDVGGLTLWRLDGPPRLKTVTRGIQANGDMTEPGYVEAYDCAGGQLELTLLPKSTSVVTLRLNGRIVQRARIAGLPYWNGQINVPPSSSPQVCRFEVDGQSLLGSTRVVFVPR
jgi:Dolichyl-phosphate-mannose-protein mannosyltransferase